MVNTVRKGYTKEKLIRDTLKNQGWLIVFKSIRWKFGTIDYGQLFDVVAYKEQDRKFISSKHFGASNYYLSHQKEIKEFKEKYGKPGESYELWLWNKARYKGRGENKQWHKGGFIKVVI